MRALLAPPQPNLGLSGLCVAGNHGQAHHRQRTGRPIVRQHTYHNEAGEKSVRLKNCCRARGTHIRRAAAVNSHRAVLGTNITKLICYHAPFGEDGPARLRREERDKGEPEATSRYVHLPVLAHATRQRPDMGTRFTADKEAEQQPEREANRGSAILSADTKPDKHTAHVSCWQRRGIEIHPSSSSRPRAAYTRWVPRFELGVYHLAFLVHALLTPPETYMGLSGLRFAGNRGCARTSSTKSRQVDHVPACSTKHPQYKNGGQVGWSRAHEVCPMAQKNNVVLQSARKSTRGVKLQLNSSFQE